MNEDNDPEKPQSQKFTDAAREHGADEDEGSWAQRLKRLVGKDRGLTGAGYWALLHDAGIEKLYQLKGGRRWMARNRHGSVFTVRDPGDMTPDQRRDIADDIIAINGN
jgi:hypothetical protein